MACRSQSRLLAILRQFLLLCFVLGALVPQAAMAGVADGSEACGVHVTCGELVGTNGMPCNVASEEMDKGSSSSEICLDMTCYFAIPSVVPRVAARNLNILIGYVPASYDTRYGINPAMLRKPPKSA